MMIVQLVIMSRLDVSTRNTHTEQNKVVFIIVDDSVEIQCYRDTTEL